MVEPKIIRKQHRRRFAVGGDLYGFIATTEETGGAFTIYETVTPPGQSAMTHTHERECEPFLILEGDLAVTSGDTVQTLAPGDFVTFPKGCHYSFRNETSQTVRFVTFLVPGGLEEMLEIVGEPVDATTEQRHASKEEVAEMVEVGKRFGVTYFPS